ncbi:MAG TPA: hypothetical protein VHV08_11835 [Pirellulales bacterium]|jgi:mono/diheme cytochrome c family protein|nr:hypothetical protein [Pirellulales bacterium]
MLTSRRVELPLWCLAVAVTSIGLAADTPASKNPAASSKESASAKVTFNEHVAPILWKNCGGCHRPGEVGPFSLLTYQDAAKRADFLAEITKSRRMPPWKAEPNFGKFMDERRLNDQEIATLAQWAKAGAPEGNVKFRKKPPEFPDGWQLGDPDLVLKMAQPFTIPADGSDIYRCFVIPIPIDKDKMISAMEFRPANRKVVHHAILFLDANGQGRKKEGQDGKPGFASFGGPGIVPTGGLGNWVPGSMPRYLPDGIVRYVQKGSDLVLQIHYHPSGKEETDQSVVGLYFSKKPMQKIVTGVAIAQPGLKLPANNAHCDITAETEPLPADVSIMGITPHMHNLGREFKVTATRSTRGDEVPLIWIKDWDFNWQGAYQFAKPVRLPKGSTIKVEAVYDNSAANPKNPNDPPQEIHWGEQTSDEMCLCAVQVCTETMSDLRKIVAMPGNELGPGLEGGVPGQAALAKRKEATKRTQDLAEKVKQSSAKTNGTPIGAGSDDGVAISPRTRKFLSQYDTDKDGKLAGDELDKLPPALKQRYAAAINKHHAAMKMEASKTATATNTAPASTSVAASAAPAETPPSDPPPAAPASPMPPPTEDLSSVEFPPDGVVIVEKYKAILAPYDLDKNNKLSRDEVDKMPPFLKEQVIKSLKGKKGK